MTHFGQEQHDDQAASQEVGGVQMHEEDGITTKVISRVKLLLGKEPTGGKSMIATMFPDAKEAEENALKSRIDKETRRKIELALNAQDPYQQKLTMTEDALMEPKSFVKALLNWKELFRKGYQRSWKDEALTLDETEAKLKPLLTASELSLLQDRWYGAHAFIDGVALLDETAEESTAKKLWNFRNDWRAMTDLARLVRNA